MQLKDNCISHNPAFQTALTVIIRRRVKLLNNAFPNNMNSEYNMIGNWQFGYLCSFKLKWQNLLFYVNKMFLDACVKVISLIKAQLTCTYAIKWIILFLFKFKIMYNKHVTWIVNEQENERYITGQPYNPQNKYLSKFISFSSHFLYLKK